MTDELVKGDAVRPANGTPVCGAENIPSAAEVTADTREPATLRRSCADNYFSSFVQQYQPVGPSEITIVRDLARQAAAMDRWYEAAGAVERQAARSLPHLALAAECEDHFADIVLAGAMTTDAADRCERHALARTRAFYRALSRLEALQANRRADIAADESQMPPPFASEADCEGYLANRLRHGNRPCGKCGSTEGYLLPAHRCWECAGCKAQVGLRAGTIMARSPIPLRPWFEAIRWLLWRPTIGTTNLAAKIRVSRLSTVRLMAQRVRSAFASDAASELLAGLDSHFVR